MELETLLSKLKTKYSFDQADYKKLSGTPDLEIRLKLNDFHIAALIERAGRLDAIVESCANLVTIFDASTPKDIRPLRRKQRTAHLHPSVHDRTPGGSSVQLIPAQEPGFAGLFLFGLK